MKSILFTLFAASVLFVFSCKQKSDNYGLIQRQQEVASISQLLASKPDSAGLRLILAYKLDSIGQYKNALLQMDTLLKADSSQYGFWVAKANILSDSGDLAAVKLTWAKALSIYPGTEAVLGMAKVLAKQQNDSSLLFAQKLSIEDAGRANYATALYFYEKDSLSQADSSIHLSITQDHYFGDAYLLKGQIALKNNQPESALAAFQQGITVDPQNVFLLNAAGELLKKSKPDSAQTYFIRSLKERPYQPAILQQINPVK